MFKRASKELLKMGFNMAVNFFVQKNKKQSVTWEDTASRAERTRADCASRPLPPLKRNRIWGRLLSYCTAPGRNTDKSNRRFRPIFSRPRNKASWKNLNLSARNCIQRNPYALSEFLTWRHTARIRPYNGYSRTKCP